MDRQRPTPPRPRRQDARGRRKSHRTPAQREPPTSPLRFNRKLSLAGSSRSWPGGVRRKGGKNVVRALVWNSGTSRVVAPLETVGTGVRRGRKPKARVPDAAHWDGLGRSSDEGAVMALERRPRTSVDRLANLA